MSDEQRAAPRRPMEHIAPETIAAWLDEPDDLSAEERAAIEEHMTGCAECRQVAVELRALVVALAALPDAELPRSFALPAEHAQPVEAPIPATRREPTPIRASSKWHDRQMRALRWATAAAAILFVVVLGVDLVTTRIDRPTSSNDAITASGPTTAAGAAAPAETTDETMAAKAAPEETPTPATGAASLAASPEATAAGAEPQPTPAAAQAETGATATADAAGSAEAFGGEPEPTSSAERTVSRREERLRLLEFGLATVFVWLLAMMIALPRLRRRRGNRS